MNIRVQTTGVCARMRPSCLARSIAHKAGPAHGTRGLPNSHSCKRMRAVALTLCGRRHAGQVSSAQALATACEDIKDVTDHTLATFKAAVKAFKKESAKKAEAAEAEAP